MLHMPRNKMLWREDISRITDTLHVVCNDRPIQRYWLYFLVIGFAHKTLALAGQELGIADPSLWEYVGVAREDAEKDMMITCWKDIRFSAD